MLGQGVLRCINSLAHSTMLQWFCSCCDATPLLHILIFVSVTNVQLLTLDNKSKYSGASLLKSWTILEIVVGFNQMHAEAVVGIVDRVITRYRRDPTCLLQILREVQEACRGPRLKASPGFIPSFIPNRVANIGCCFLTTSPIVCRATGR
jgi:hypothetical protein